MVHTFPGEGGPKVKMIARLEFELTYCDVEIQLFSPQGFPHTKMKIEFKVNNSHNHFEIVHELEFLAMIKDKWL